MVVRICAACLPGQRGLWSLHDAIRPNRIKLWIAPLKAHKPSDLEGVWADLKTVAFCWCSLAVAILIIAVSVKRSSAMKTTWPVLLGLLLMAAPAAVQAQFDYTVNADNTINITGYTGPPWSVTIPTNINGLTVTTIGADAFAQSSLASITIPNSVKGIGSEAFYFSRSLASVTIGTGVTNMENEAFYYCTSLTYLTISNGSTSIGPAAFESCTSLTNVTIPGSVNTIEDYAFSECSSLASVTICNGVTSIGENAFEQCDLKSVTIPGSVNNIQDDAFYACNNLLSVFFLGNAPTADSTVFAGDNSNPVI